MFFVEEPIRQLVSEFDNIPRERRDVLNNMASFVEDNNASKLIFICTHNSRRSHMAQVWAQTAAAYFNISGVRTYSGGTEATAFNPKAVSALIKIGFKIEKITQGANPHYLVLFSNQHPPLHVFSKKYNAAENPQSGFAAIMTCSHADEHCPVISGASVRIAVPYDDPKDFDGTIHEFEKYLERSLEIGREMLFVFSLIKRS